MNPYDENIDPRGVSTRTEPSRRALNDLSNVQRAAFAGKEGASKDTKAVSSNNGASWNNYSSSSSYETTRPAASRSTSSSNLPAQNTLPLTRPVYPVQFDDGFEYEDIDFGDELDPQMCKEYVAEIFEHLLAQEAKYQPSDNYMINQPDINDRMRTIVYDWLVDVHLKFKLLPETLYLTFNYCDRFLERKSISRTKIQLLGITALLIASKYEEIYAPEVRDCVFITDRAYTKEEIYKMERSILATLMFDMAAPNIASFMKRFVKAAGGDQRFRMLATYFCELTMLEYKMLKFKPSMVVASAISIALRIYKKRTWSQTLENYTTYTESSLHNCIQEMIIIIKKAVNATQHTAIRNKFASPNFLEVSKMNFSDL